LVNSFSRSKNRRFKKSELVGPGESGIFVRTCLLVVKGTLQDTCA
jgi:hypothetical protein